MKLIRDPARFEMELSNFFQRYSDPQARDSMFEYLKMLSKPHTDTPREFADRVILMARYSNKLAGTEPLLMEQQVKNIIFQAMPMVWKQNYIRAGKDVAADTLETIVQYMSNEKGFSDQCSRSDDDPKKRKKKETDTTSDKKQHGSQSYGYNSPCRKHSGTHAWGQCWDNPRGSNYRPNRNQGGRGGRGGFGGGRGPQPGRGFSHGGRGNGHQGGRGRGYGHGRGCNGGHGHSNQTNNSYQQQNHQGCQSQGCQSQQCQQQQHQCYLNQNQQGVPEGNNLYPTRVVPPVITPQEGSADVHHFDMIGHGQSGGSAEMAEGTGFGWTPFQQNQNGNGR